MPFLEDLRIRALTKAIDVAIHAAAAAAARLPRFDLEARGVRVARDVRYATHDPVCTLDVYTPPGAEGAPVVLYVHGGGFKLGSKRSHAAIAQPLVDAGFVTVMIDYRLAPAHPFPAALEDCAEALRWVAANASRFGGDGARVAVAGESAGGNLTSALALATTRRFALPPLARLFDLGIVPVAVLPLCGLLEVSRWERFETMGARPSRIVRDRMKSASIGYLAGADARYGLELADPLVVLESATELERPHPPVFVSVGERDPILDDSLRLARALAARGVRHVLRVEPGAYHAYQALVVFPSAERHWTHAIEFLRAELGAIEEAPRARSA